MPVGIVTDSTAYLPKSVVAELGIEVVELQVISNGIAYNEVDGITVEQVAIALRANKPVTTSRPNPELFVAAYERLISNGADSIVSTHLSSDLSGTFESAKLASRSVSCPVEVIDSRGIAMMLGFAVQAGAKLARSGGSLNEVGDLVKRKCLGSSILFYVDSLEFLERGGRINAVQARMGSAMNLKPLLHMLNGKVEQRELVRTREKALNRMVDLVCAAARINSEIAVHHVDAAAAADELAGILQTRTGLANISVSAVGAVVGVHVGPGALAIVVSPQV
jgi:DegV family protein with EDD domain